MALDLNLRQTPTASAAGSSSSSSCCARASEWWGGGMPCKRPRIDRGKDESACSGEGSRRRSGSGHEALREWSVRLAVAKCGRGEPCAVYRA